MAFQFTLACVLLFLSTAYSLTCYKCDSSSSVLCNYGLTSITYQSVDCESESAGGILTSFIPKQCVKIVAKSKDGSEYVARGCAPHLGGTCSAVVKTLNFFTNVEGSIEDMNCYTCDGDKCNSARKFTGITFFGLILVAVAFLL